MLVLLMGLSTVVNAVPRGLRLMQSGARAQSISRHGITWHFDREVTYGQFANGDYWVLGPVTVVGIDPVSVNNGGVIDHGSMLNPTQGDIQGFTTRQGTFSAANNVGRPGGNAISPANPLVINPNASLASSRTGPTSDSRFFVQDVSILTVLAAAPPEGSFRPPYSNMEKRLFNVSDIRWDNLPRLGAIPESMPPLATLETYQERTWFTYDGVTSGTTTNGQPANMVQKPGYSIYGRDIAHMVGEVSLALLLDFEPEQLETLMIRFLQYGIDTYGVIAGASSPFNRHYYGHIWTWNGGIGHGRKWPVLFAGLMFDDEAMLMYSDGGGYRDRWNHPYSQWGNSGYPIYQEDAQFFYVQQEDVDQPPHTADGRPRGDYTVEMIGLPEWGEMQAVAPARSGPAWNAAYRPIVTNSMIGHVLAAIIMGAREQWNWEPIFDYMDRWVAAGEAGEHGRWRDRHDINDVEQFVKDMWKQYRGDYPPFWSD